LFNTPRFRNIKNFGGQMAATQDCNLGAERSPNQRRPDMLIDAMIIATLAMFAAALGTSRAW
jgi:hypothetical protein